MKTKILNTHTLHYLSLLTFLFFLHSSFAQIGTTPIAISFDNPTPLPTSCNRVFTEKGVPLQFLAEDSICSFTYFNSNTDFNPDTTRFILVNTTLSANLSSLGIIEKIEVDAFSICNFCTTVSLLNNDTPYFETQNIIPAIVQTLTIENPTLSPVDELKIFGKDLANIYEIRIFADASNICEGTSDSDGDFICDALDACPNFDDSIDRDGNGISDYCDSCTINRIMQYPNFAGENISYNSVEQIYSAQAIFDGAVISFNAGDLISLDIGFEVQLGAEFSAAIIGCTL